MTVTAADARPTAPAPRRAPASRPSDRARRSSASAGCSPAPACIVMLLVTAYPVPTPSYLSLFSYRLTDPDGRSSSGPRNYVVILTDGLWWQPWSTTVLITVVTVAVEFVLGFALRHGHAPGHLRAPDASARRSWSPTASSPSSRPTPGSTRSPPTSVRQPVVRPRRPGLVRRTARVAVRDLPVGDLEDDAVHVAAAARRPRAGARRPAGGGQGRRRHRLAAPSARSRCRT